MDPTVLSLTGARSFENGGSVMEGEPPSKKQKVGGEEDKDAKDKKRRAYRACLHCRNRKAKCDLGDLQNPRDPPCSRCRRESRECIFVPSKRGGRVKKEADVPSHLGESTTPVISMSADAEVSPSTSSGHHMSGSLVSAKINNPSDALQLLVMTAEGQDDSHEDGNASANLEHVSPSEASLQHPSPPVPFAANLEDTPICQQHIVTPAQLSHFMLDVFFVHVHPLFPFISPGRVPKDVVALGAFVKTEPHVTLAAVIVAARVEQCDEVHDRAWRAFEQVISKLVLGENPSLGSIEALLLLAEHMPRQNVEITSEIQRMRQEERVAWSFVGLAIRFGYLLGLDQATFVSNKPTDPQELDLFERQRVLWTHCYVHDRSITIQLGKAFWSRGPGLCFDIRPMLLPAKEGSYRNFPSLRPENSAGHDFAALLQAYVELTQILSSAHDILFATKEQTMSLQKSGGYYTFLDQFRHALNSFRAAWSDYHWTHQTLADVLMATFHYARQYCYSFAFSAHVFRFADATANDPRQSGGSIFPRGIPSIPDSKYIIEGIDAAEEVLRIFVSSLYPRGHLSCLPDRFFSYWAYSGVFLLKAVFVAAVMPEKQRSILRLVKSSTFCLASASPDEQHVGVRYARLLNGLIRTFSNSDIHTPRYTATPAPAASTSMATAGPSAQPDIDVSNPFSDFLGLSLGQEFLPRHPTPGMPSDHLGGTPSMPQSELGQMGGMPFDFSQFDLVPSAMDDPLSAFYNEQALDADFWRGLGT